MKTTSPLLVLALLQPGLFSISMPRCRAAADQPAEKAEVVIYGGTPSGVMAAVAAAAHGHSVALIDINNHVGGVVSGGLVSTDIGDRKTVGGLADAFFKRLVKFY